METKKKCVYCGGHLTRFRVDKLTQIDDYDEIDILKRLTNLELIHGKCDDCGSIIATDERMSDNNVLIDAYTEAPDSYVYDNNGFSKHEYFYRNIENIINPSSKKLSICDVGCNSGEFLKMLGSYWQKHGVEPSYRALNVLKSDDISVFHGTLSNSPFRKNSMDVITYFDVFEHLKNPTDEVETAKRFLAPNGKIVILTGDASSLTAKLAGATWSYLKQTGHIAIATKRAIENTLQEAGFNSVTVMSLSHPYSRSFFDYLVLLTTAKLFNNPSKIRLLNKQYTVPLFRDHMLVIASL